MARLIVKLLFLSFLLSSIFVDAKRHSRNEKVGRSKKIIGGSAAQPHTIPYQILFLQNGSPFCGGSIISANFILTAAHCMLCRPRDIYCYDDFYKDLVVVAGDHDYTIEEGTEQFRTIKDFKHHGFNFRNNDNDIAVVYVEQPFDFSERFVQPIQLNQDKSYMGKVTVSGWGYTNKEGTAVPAVLQKLALKMMPNQKCKNQYEVSHLADETFCYESGGHQTTCSGDSGGPIVNENNGNPVLVGVHNFGYENCDYRRPSGGTRVAYYIEWIENAKQEIINDLNMERERQLRWLRGDRSHKINYGTLDDYYDEIEESQI